MNLADLRRELDSHFYDCTYLDGPADVLIRTRLRPIYRRLYEQVRRPLRIRVREEGEQ